MPNKRQLKERKEWREKMLAIPVKVWVFDDEPIPGDLQFWDETFIPPQEKPFVVLRKDVEDIVEWVRIDAIILPKDALLASKILMLTVRHSVRIRYGIIGESWVQKVCQPISFVIQALELGCTKDEILRFDDTDDCMEKHEILWSRWTPGISWVEPIGYKYFLHLESEGVLSLDYGKDPGEDDVYPDWTYEQAIFADGDIKWYHYANYEDRDEDWDYILSSVSPEKTQRYLGLCGITSDWQ
jgi:hypothetical protein